jgi:putative membrane protein
MRRLLVTWAFNVAALYVAAAIVDGLDYGDDAWVLVLAAVVFSLVNMIVKPVVTFLALPLILITLGIALFLVNILMLYLTDWVVGGFEIDSFGAAVLGTILIWIVNWALDTAFGMRARGDD